jgi:hypothetical protein
VAKRTPFIFGIDHTAVQVRHNRIQGAQPKVRHERAPMPVSGQPGIPATATLLDPDSRSVGVQVSLLAGIVA